MLQVICEGPGIDVLTDEIELAGVGILLEVVNVDNIRMPEGSLDAGLLLELGAELLEVAVRRQHFFDGHIAAKIIFGVKHLAIGAGADGANIGVLAAAGRATGGERHRRILPSSSIASRYTSASSIVPGTRVSTWQTTYQSPKNLRNLDGEAHALASHRLQKGEAAARSANLLANLDQYDFQVLFPILCAHVRPDMVSKSRIVTGRPFMLIQVCDQPI